MSIDELNEYLKRGSKTEELHDPRSYLTKNKNRLSFPGFDVSHIPVGEDVLAYLVMPKIVSNVDVEKQKADGFPP